MCFSPIHMKRVFLREVSSLITLASFFFDASLSIWQHKLNQLSVSDVLNVFNFGV